MIGPFLMQLTHRVTYPSQRRDKELVMNLPVRVR